MSTTIDDRVVEMRFDNSNFEQNVGQTLSTLDKLKLALNLPGATKGLNDISAAAKNVDMAPMSKAIDTVQAKFSALDVVAFTALQNITNSVLNTGKKIIDQFTIEPIRTGFNEYELKMGSVQTIMASTGESIDTVNKYLEELNKYSDQTIYSFSDMTQNIGKFTNAGVSLKDAVAAIKGVSNEAAISGANANEASRAMYNFAQALSAGYVKLIDWKSIENANMATVEFKNELLKTALACKTVADAGDGMYQVLTTNNKGSSMEDAIDATHNFNDSLNYQWMTTEVLTKTLAKYADASTDLGKKAFAAAQDVKTFSMMMDTLKEAAQSGWAQTWETIVGDFEEAKEVWTDFSEIFSNVIGSIDEARNKLLRGGLSSSWKQLTDRITDSGVAMDEFEDSLANVVNSHGEDYTKIILDHKNLAKAIQNGAIQGKWLSEAYMKLTENAADLKDETTGLNKYTDEELKKMTALRTELGDVSSNARGLLRTLTQESGREYIFETLRNTLNGVVKLTSTFAHAWRDVIPPVLTSERLYKALETIGKFSRNLVLSDENADKLRRTLRGLLAPLGIISNILGKIGGTAAKVIGKILGLGDKLSFNILDYAAKLGDVLYNFEQWITSVDGLGKYWGKLEDKLFKGLSLVKKYMQAFLDLPPVRNAIDTVKASVKDFAETLPDRLSSAAVGFKNFVVDFYEGARDYIRIIKNMPSVQNTFKAFKEGFSNFLGDVPAVFHDGVERMRGFIETVKNMDGLTLDNVKSAIKLFGKTVYDYFSSIFKETGSLRARFEQFAQSVSDAMKWTNGAIGSNLNKFHNFIEMVKELTVAIKEFVIEHKGALIAIGASAGMIAAIYKIGKALKVMAKPLFDAGEFLGGISGALNTIATGMNKKMKAEAVKTYAEALVMLAGSLLLLSRIPIEDLGKAVVTIGLLAGILVAVAFAMNKLKGSGLKENAGNALNGSVILMLAASLVTLVFALKQLDTIEHPERIKTNLLYLAGMLAALVIAAKVLGGGKSILRDARSSASGLQILALATGLRIMVGALNEIGQYDLATIAKSMLMVVGVAFALKLVMKTLRGIKGGAGFAAIAAVLSLMLLVRAFKQIAELDLDQAKHNLGAFIVIFGMFAGLMAASKLAGKYAASAGAGIFLMSTSLITLAIGMRMLAKLSASELRKGTEAIIGIFAAFAIVVAASKFAGKYAARAGIMIGAMSASLILLAGAIWILSTLDPDGLDRGVKAIEGIIACFALLIAASGLASKSTSVIVTITIAVGMLAIAIAGLSMIPADQLKGATNALSQVLIIFGVVMALSRFAGKDVFKTLIVITIAIGMIATALYLLKDLDPKSALANATAISEVLLAISLATKILEGEKGVAKSKLASLAVMVAVIAGIGAVLGVMAYFDVSASLANATAISEVLLALSVALRILSNTKALKPGTIVSVGVMVGVVAALGLVLAVLCEFQNIDKAIVIATAISELIVALSASMVLIALAGNLGLGATAGILGLIEVITAVGAFMIAVGALAEYFPSLENFLTTGIDLLNQVASGIGSFVGNLIHGFVEGLTGYSSLSDIGDELSAFMDSLQPFLTAAKGLDSSVIKGIGTLVACVAAVTAADAINGFRNLPIIRKFLGTGSMSQFGQELADFAEPLKTFVTTFKDAGIDADTVEGVANAAKCITEFANAIPNQGGKLADWIGDNTLSTFGDELVAFAPKFRMFIAWTKGIKAEDTEGVSAAATAVAEFAKIVPNQGGFLADFLGDNTLSTFGDELAAFGPRFRMFVAWTKGIKAEDTEGVTAAATAVAKFADIVPNQGGLLAGILGDNTLSTFGSELLAFAPGFKLFIAATKDIKASDTEGVVAAASAVAAFADIVPNQGGILGAIFGGNTPLTNFGTDVEAFGTKFKNFYNDVKDVNTTSIGTAINAMTTIMDLGQGEAPDSSIYTQLFTAVGTMGRNFKGFYDNIKDIDASRLNSFTSMVRTIASIANDAEGINAGAFLNITEAIKNLGSADMSAFGDGISEAIPDIKMVIDQMMTTMMTTISSYTPRVSLAFATMLNDMTLTLSSRNGAFSTAAQAMMDGFANGLTSNQYRMSRIVGDMMNGVVSTLNSRTGDFGTAGAACIGQFSSGFQTGQSENIKSVYTMLGEIIGAISSKNETMYSSGRALMANFTNGLSSQNATAVGAISRSIGSVLNKANSYRSSFRNAAVQLMQNFISGLNSKTTSVRTTFTNTLTSTVNRVRGYSGDFRAAGITLMMSLASGARAVSVTGSFTGGVSDAVYTLESYHSDFYDAGRYLVQGFANGMSNYAYIAKNAAKYVGDSAVTALKNATKEHSPSKITYGFGRYFTEGFVNGITDTTMSAVRSSESLGVKATTALQKTLSTLNTMIDEGIDSQPTIRPVIDMSNVQSGIGQINSMLDLGTTVDLGYSGIITGRLSDTTAAMSQQEQINILRRMSTLMDSYFPQFREHDVYLDTGVIAGSVNRKLGLQS